MDRIQRLITQTGLQSQQAILIHKTSNIFYLSGYTGEGLLLLSHDLKAIITDFRYIEQAANQASDFEVFCISNEVNHIKLAAQLLNDKKTKSLLYEDDCVTVKGFHEMQASMPGIGFFPLELAPEKIRTIKDENELKLIQKACMISTQAFEFILGFIKTGLTEKQIQLALNYKMLELGAQKLAFDSIVASGPNGSLPHAIAGEREVQKGDLITLDFGAMYQGYCADMTRTVALGVPSKELYHIYETVLLAQTSCQDSLAP
ncbi:MAG: aminopeptidase P family protein, partial [Clostridiales bacterium]|nr:aminopeptidase P family protein [Clostridiales bacterium]